MSFSLGRPDTLGLDEYHNRNLPTANDTEYAIIPCMVDFGRIVRKVAIEIYHSHLSLQQKLLIALKIENEMNEWVVRLPRSIKPSLGQENTHLGGLRDPKWSRRQKLVLGIRNYPTSILLRKTYLWKDITMFGCCYFVHSWHIRAVTGKEHLLVLVKE